MPKVIQKKIERTYSKLSGNDIGRMMELRDDPDTAISRKGRRPSIPVDTKCVKNEWSELTALGEAVVAYHESLD